MSRGLRGPLRRLRSDGGFTIIELTSALTIIAIGFFALASAIGAGSRYLVQAKRRQAASEKSNAYIEHLRNIPYDDIGLAALPTRSEDPADPDYFLSSDGSGYDYAGSGTYESIVTGGSLGHIETVTVGTTDLTVYQYVTWVDDGTMIGTQDYKRATIIAQYEPTGAGGVPRVVQVSALVTRDSVTVGGSTPGAQPGSTSSPSPSSSPTPEGECNNDTEGPTGSIDLLSGSGAEDGFTSSGTVTVSLSATDACTPITYQLSNDNSTWSAEFTFNPTATTTLTDGDGLKSVYARFRDGIGNERTVGPDTITRDSTPPPVPGTLSRTVSCQGSNRTVNLSWGSSASDANLVGYRLYRSIDNADYGSPLLTSSQQSASDTHLKTYDSVRFYVEAYDKAGNKSDATNTISLSKNQCS